MTNNELKILHAKAHLVSLQKKELQNHRLINKWKRILKNLEAKG